MGFVVSTWMKSHIHNFRDRYRANIARAFREQYLNPILSERPAIVVLYSPDAPRTLHGHAVMTDGVLAWSYVAYDLRREGYCRQLITALLGDYPKSIPTHSAWPFDSNRYIFQKYERRAA